jgi:hypothetical protein
MFATNLGLFIFISLGYGLYWLVSAVTHGLLARFSPSSRAPERESSGKKAF